MIKRKVRKVIKRTIVSFFGLVLIMIFGLIANNRVMALKSSKLDTDMAVLSSSEISAIGEVYEYLNTYGDDIFMGLKDNTDLIIFNNGFEFLICDSKAEPGWDIIDHNAGIGKNIYSREADDPQAFAVFAGGKWIGSMSTKNTFNQSMVDSVPLFFPPQLIIADDAHYRALVIHEMVHAYQANNNSTRVGQSQTLHDVCENYYEDQTFHEYMVEEAYYLEQAITAVDYEEVLAYSQKFIETREKRRTQCKMSTAEIQNEVDFEWLEGLARYAEYKASAGSNSPVAKNLLDIDQKVKVKGDDRYYTLGMAQALVLDKLQEDWKNDIFTDDFSLERCIQAICLSY